MVGGGQKVKKREWDSCQLSYSTPTHTIYLYWGEKKFNKILGNETTTKHICCPKLISFNQNFQLVILIKKKKNIGIKKRRELNGARTKCVIGCEIIAAAPRGGVNEYSVFRKISSGKN